MWWALHNTTLMVNMKRGGGGGESSLETFIKKLGELLLCVDININISKKCCIPYMNLFIVFKQIKGVFLLLTK